MRRLAGAMIGLALSGAAVDARAQTPPEGLTWYVLDQLNGFGFDIDDPTNRPALITEAPEGVLVPVEANDDGRTDWLIAWPASSQFCGTGGCRRTLYIGSDDDGFVRAFDRQALELEIGRVDGEIRVQAQVHHLECTDDRTDCLYAWTWDPAQRRLIERPSSDGYSRIAGTPPIDAGEDEHGVPPVPPGAPLNLQEHLWASREVCLSEAVVDGYVIRQAQAIDIPDLNGDGLRDYMVSPADACDDLSPLGIQIWLTAGEGAPAVPAYQAPLERWLEYEVSERPATVLVVAPCDGGRDCPGVPLRLDPATGRLVE